MAYRALHYTTRATTALVCGLVQVHLSLSQLHLRLSLDIGQGEPVGSVSLAVGVVWLECIKEDVAQMRSAAITNNFQATKLGHGAHMAAVSLL